jgi:hypothetical protein
LIHIVDAVHHSLTLIADSYNISMKGYEIVAQALAKQGVQHAYGIVGDVCLTQEFPSLNWATQFRVPESAIMGSETSNRLRTLRVIADS